ncbi:MAG TPA: hypothetical protein VL325_10625 [Pyrinomonadaceae bacterium]|jgi:hypothetical protein|nr:hypothetical protein [Pyrinomonadaceae bacterium]
MSDDVADKPYTIVFQDCPTYLYALVHGDKYGYEVLAAFLREIAAECEKRNFRNVLIEENISATTSEDDVIRTASELPQFGFANIRMAYIDRFTDQRELNEFGRQIAVKSGVDVRIFNTFGDADDWLSDKN